LLDSLLQEITSVMEFTVYKKTDDIDEEFAGKGAKKKKQKEKSPKNHLISDGSGSNNGMSNDQGKKTKFVPIYSQDGKAAEAVQLPGRHPCDCQTLKHPLVNNCLSCGKIICVQEGSGPCLFCGALVVTNQEQAILDKKNKKSEKLYEKLVGDSRAQYQAAVDNKNRLLDYQANSAKRTQIIDDESDYFNVDNNKWLTPEQREAMKKKKEELHEEKHKSRLDRKITFDFAGRRVVEEEHKFEYDFNQDTELLKMFKNDAFSVEAEIKRRSEAGDIVNPNIARNRPVYDESAGGLGVSQDRKAISGMITRVQDRELMEMSDDGMCLSMHQPWASLLVMGIKIHEGRTWYSQHRGRLWIHAGSKVPTPEDIKDLENFYRIHTGEENLPFPSHYPTSCLLGSVDMTQCLAQEEYREVYPEGESSSPYVFICTNPQEMMIKFPMSGKHKMFKLDSKLHAAAKKTVKKTL